MNLTTKNHTEYNSLVISRLGFLDGFLMREKKLNGRFVGFFTNKIEQFFIKIEIKKSNGSLFPNAINGSSLKFKNERAEGLDINT